MGDRATQNGVAVEKTNLVQRAKRMFCSIFAKNIHGFFHKNELYASTAISKYLEFF